MAFYREGYTSGLALTDLKVRYFRAEIVYKRLVNLCVYVTKEFLF